MKIKVKKEGKKKEYKLIESWSDVTLEKWVKLAELKGLTKSEEAKGLITALSDIPEKIVSQLQIQDVSSILKRITELQVGRNLNLQKIIKVDGKEYGFRPDLEEITLGEYADIETMIKDGTEKNIHRIMAVLYRPNKLKKNNAYIIESYDGKIDVRAEEFKKMNAEQVESSMLFFWNFVSRLLKILPLYLMEQVKEMKKQTQEKVLLKNGVTLD